MAYILSNINTTIPGIDTGQRLFKFDPLTFSSSALWSKRTTISGSGNDFGALGLTFGRNQVFLYAFSLFSGFNTLTMLDQSG